MNNTLIVCLIRGEGKEKKGISFLSCVWYSKRKGSKHYLGNLIPLCREKLIPSTPRFTKVPLYKEILFIFILFFYFCFFLSPLFLPLSLSTPLAASPLPLAVASSLPQNMLPPNLQRKERMLPVARSTAPQPPCPLPLPSA